MVVEKNQKSAMVIAILSGRNSRKKEYKLEKYQAL